MAYRPARGFPGSLGSFVPRQSAPHGAVDERDGVAAVRPRGAPATDALVRPARHERRRPSFGLSLHPRSGSERRSHASRRRSECRCGDAVHSVHAAERACSVADRSGKARRAGLTPPASLIDKERGMAMRFSIFLWLWLCERSTFSSEERSHPDDEWERSRGRELSRSRESRSEMHSGSRSRSAEHPAPVSGYAVFQRHRMLPGR